MKWFGQAWGPICGVVEQVAVPTGARCTYCGEEVGPQDSGVIMPHMTNNTWAELPNHRECFIRTIFGSIGHQLRTCSCYGGKEGDPEGLTLREAAKLVDNWMFQHSTIPKGEPQ